MTVTVTDVVSYMGEEDALRWRDELGNYPEIERALATERSAQDKAVCWDSLHEPDVEEALCRRVVHNLAMRSLPLAVMPGNLEAGTGPVRPSMQDPEVRRLEGPYRKLVMG
jgi:hypothetical protein